MYVPKIRISNEPHETWQDMLYGWLSAILLWIAIIGILIFVAWILHNIK
jgi:hypothetical protein